MFPKKKRVTKKIFNEIIKKGVSFSSNFFIFKFISHKDEPRYAFVVPKKISKKATIRNKIKRRGYNIIKPLPIKNSSGIFFYKKRGLKASYEELKNEIIFILKKAKII